MLEGHHFLKNAAQITYRAECTWSLQVSRLVQTDLKKAVQELHILVNEQLMHLAE